MLSLRAAACRARAQRSVWRGAQRCANPRISLVRNSSSSTSADAWAVLGLPRSAGRAEVKKRFYELAKAQHPDVVQQRDGIDAEEAHVSFVRISAAFDQVIEEIDCRRIVSGATPGTAASTAARGGAASARRGAEANARPRYEHGRTKSLGEILCAQLRDDPSLASAIWKDVLAQECDVRESMLDELFRACAANGEGLPAALAILRDAT